MQLRRQQLGHRCHFKQTAPRFQSQGSAPAQDIVGSTGQLAVSRVNDLQGQQRRARQHRPHQFGAPARQFLQRRDARTVAAQQTESDGRFETELTGQLKEMADDETVEVSGLPAGEDDMVGRTGALPTSETVTDPPGDLGGDGAVGRVLATTDGEHAAGRLENLMLARDLRGTDTPCRHQRPQTGEGGDNLVAARRPFAQVATALGDEIGDILLAGDDTVRIGGKIDVGSADEGEFAPGENKEEAGITP